MLIKMPEPLHACWSPKWVPILKAVKWMHNSCCWNEQLMQIPSSSWNSFETRQMVQPQNRDCTNFTERRFSQDSEHKWVDGKIVVAHKLPLCSTGWAVAGVLWCPMCEAVFIPASPWALSWKAGSLNMRFQDLFNLSAAERIFDKGAYSLQHVRASPRVVKTQYQNCRSEKLRMPESYLFV